LDHLLVFREKMGRISGLIDALDPDIREQTVLNILVSEAVKTSEIEGEYVSRADVMS